MSDEPWTILRVLTWTTQYFERCGLPTPRLDAEVLLAHLLECDRVGLYIRFEQPLEQAELTRFRGLVRRRASGEPAAYITGVKEFWSLPLKVDPRVLIPRPETELVVDLALELSADHAPEGILCDVGTGSGAIALAFKKERTAWQVVATDVSDGALEVARENAARLGLEVELLQGDLLEPLAHRAPCDLIVSNPPYLATGDLPHLMTEVRDHEPRSALVAGADGLDTFRRLIADAAHRLRPAGALILEVGDHQAAAVRALLAASSAYAPAHVRRDHAGRERVVWAARRP